MRSTRRCGRASCSPGLTESTIAGVRWDTLFGTPTRWVSAVYLSAAFLILATVGARRSRRRAAVAALVLGVLAVGAATPIGRLAALLPVLSSLRYPAKFLPFALVAAAVVAGGALGDLPRRSRPLTRALAATSVLVGALTVVVALADRPWPLTPFVQATVVAALLALCARRGWYTAFAAVVLVDVGAQAYVALPLGPPVLDAPSLVAALAADPRTVLCTSLSSGNVQLQSGVGDRRYDLVAAWRAYGLHGLNVIDGLRSGLPYETLQSNLSTELEVALADPTPAVPVALGCTHVVTAKPVDGLVPAEPNDVNAVADAAAARPRLFRVRDALPDVFPVREPLRCDDEDCVLRAIFASDSATPIRHVVDDPFHHLTDAALPDGHGASGVDIALDREDALRLSVRGTGGVVLGYKRALQTGWQATQAGRALPVVRATGNHLAVVVDDVTAGPIDLVYRPTGLVPGLLAALLGTLLGVVGVVVLRRAR